jgi:hypothetical protein
MDGDRVIKDLHDVETRETSATGGQKGVKLTQVGALDPVALIELGRVAGMGANKYSPYNYLKGTEWSKMFNAAMRHALLFWSGEDTDPESGLSHAAHASWMFQALVSFSLRGLGTDDRFKRDVVLDLQAEASLRVLEQQLSSLNIGKMPSHIHQYGRFGDPHQPGVQLTCGVCGIVKEAQPFA